MPAFPEFGVWLAILIMAAMVVMGVALIGSAIWLGVREKQPPRYFLICGVTLLITPLSVASNHPLPIGNWLDTVATAMASEDLLSPP
ncbi:MAG: hypothetical protein AAGE65_12685 [Planctomycetota bacterium]